MPPRFPKYFNDKFDSNGLRVTQYIMPWIQFDVKKHFTETRFTKSKYGQLGLHTPHGYFDSVSEYIRWRILFNRQKLGKIRDLKRQIEYKCNIRKFTYIADFSYWNENYQCNIVEDVKSPKLLHSPRFQKAQHMMQEKYGITIKIISPNNLLI